MSEGSMVAVDTAELANNAPGQSRRRVWMRSWPPIWWSSVGPCGGSVADRERWSAAAAHEAGSGVSATGEVQAHQAEVY